MVFSSILFLVYFLPFFLAGYYLAPARLKNFVILIASIVFYSWGAPRFIFVILGTTLLDFYLVRLMYASKSRIKRRILLTLSVFVNVGLLFYFKYFDFFISNVNAILENYDLRVVSWFDVVLPIGISFYTFETITYVVDVYRGVHAPLKNFWNYQLYIILFPKLIAGPIVRYHEIADQIEDRKANETVSNRISGFIRFIAGLSKKIIIANAMGEYADSVFAQPAEQLPALISWLGILSYTMQIYFDFSGYSDMAIGIGRMIGFRFPENFNNPYVSRSITEFWRRWHITLGLWMRNYLYIPLGGNRVKSNFRLYFNLWIVFLASGLWHGASWNFIIWGAFHGFFLVIERAGLLKFYDFIGRIPSMLITFFIVVHGWVFFRIEGFYEAIAYIDSMYSFRSGYINLSRDFISLLAIALLIAFSTAASPGRWLEKRIYQPDSTMANLCIMALLAIVLYIYCLSALSVSGFNPFIYFRF